MSTPFSVRAARRAFTLVEVLVALAIGALAMTTAAYFMTSVAQAWFNRDQGRFFQEHTDGVLQFLNALMARAEPLPNSTAPVSWRRPQGLSELEEERLGCLVREAPALLGEGAPEAGALLYLELDADKGLNLLWRARLSAAAEDDPPVRSAVSPFLTKAEYGHFDPEEEAWEFTEAPAEDENGAKKVPELLRLTFAHEEEERVALLFLPHAGLPPGTGAAGPALPLF